MKLKHWIKQYKAKRLKQKHWTPFYQERLGKRKLYKNLIDATRDALSLVNTFPKGGLTATSATGNTTSLYAVEQNDNGEWVLVDPCNPKIGNSGSQNN